MGGLPMSPRWTRFNPLFLLSRATLGKGGPFYFLPMEELFDLDQHLPGPKIDAEYVLNQVDDLLIFRFYVGDFKLGAKVKSPLRKGGHISITLGTKDTQLSLRYKDWVTGEVGDCFKLVSRIAGITYYEAILKVACDFGLVKGCSIVTKKQIQDARLFKDKAQQEYLIQVDVRPMSSAELAYWAQYNITKDELKANHIYAIKTLWINKKQMHLRPELHFAYHFPDVDKFKIYSPDSKVCKWFGNVSAFTIEGMKELLLMDFADERELPGNPVIITKSRKDRMIIRKLYRNVCNCQNEAETAIPKEMDEVFDLAEAKFCWFDSDEPGKTANRKLNHRGYKWINIPNDLYNNFGLKDPADVIKYFGWEEGSKILIDLMKQKEILW